MNDETAIPVFPCASPDETIEFYQAILAAVLTGNAQVGFRGDGFDSSP